MKLKLLNATNQTYHNSVVVSKLLLNTLMQMLAESKRRLNKDERHSSLEKYTSHFIWKGYSRFYCERDLETEQNSNILTPTLLAITTFLSRSPGLLNRRPTLLGAGFLYCILSPTDWTSCAPSYIIFPRPPSSCGRHKSHSFNPSTVKVIFWYSSTVCTCYLHRCISYFDCPTGSEVNIQHYHIHKCTLIFTLYTWHI